MALDISKLKQDNKNECILHLVDPKLNKNHLVYWIGIFDESSISISYLVRDKKSFQELAVMYPNHQILFAATPVDVETVINSQPFLKAIFFPLNAAKNIHLLRFNHLKHIFIGTKHSDHLSVLNKSYRAYDEIWLSSQFMVDKYKETFKKLGHLQLKKVGKPQFRELIKKVEQSNTKTSIFIKIGKNRKNKGLVNYLSSILLDLKGESFSILSKEKTSLSALRNFIQGYSLNVQIYEDSATEELLALQSKYIISDIETLSVFDLLYSKPICIFIPEDIDKSSLTLPIPLESLYCFSSLKELKSIVNSLQEDPLKAKRDYYAQYFLGKKEIINNTFLQELDKL